MTSAYPDIHREILSDGNYRGEALHRVLRCCYDNLSGEIVLPCTVIMDYITPANSIEELVFVSRSDISRFKDFRSFRQKSSLNYYHFLRHLQLLFPAMCKYSVKLKPSCLGNISRVSNYNRMKPSRATVITLVLMHSTTSRN